MPVVETGESEDVETRVRPHCDGTGLGRAQIWRIGTHSRKQCEIWAQFQPNPLASTSSLHNPPRVRQNTLKIRCENDNRFFEMFGDNQRKTFCEDHLHLVLAFARQKI